MSLTKSPLRAVEDLGESMEIHHLVEGYEVRVVKGYPDVFIARVEVVTVYRAEVMKSVFTQRWQYEVKPTRSGVKVSLIGIVNEADCFICDPKWTLHAPDAYLRNVAKVAWQIRDAVPRWKMGKPLDPAFGSLAKPCDAPRRERPKASKSSGPDFAPFSPFSPFTPFGESTAKVKAKAPPPPPKPPPAARVSDDEARRKAEDTRRAAEAFDRFWRTPLSDGRLPPGVRRALSVLGLPTDALPAADALKAAWVRLARTAHPDTGGSEAAFIAAKQAHDVVRSAMAGAA